MAIDATRILMKYPEEHDVDMSREQKAGADPLNCREVNFVRTAEPSKTLNGMRYPMIVISLQRHGYRRTHLASPCTSLAR